jgi:hypothetical protein
MCRIALPMSRPLRLNVRSESGHGWAIHTPAPADLARTNTRLSGKTDTDWIYGHDAWTVPLAAYVSLNPERATAR